MQAVKPDRLHTVDGDDVGEATYPSMVKVGEELFFGGGCVVVFDEEDDSPFVGYYRPSLVRRFRRRRRARAKASVTLRGHPPYSVSPCIAGTLRARPSRTLSQSEQGRLRVDPLIRAPSLRPRASRRKRLQLPRWRAATRLHRTR